MGRPCDGERGLACHALGKDRETEELEEHRADPAVGDSSSKRRIDRNSGRLEDFADQISIPGRGGVDDERNVVRRDTGIEVTPYDARREPHFADVAGRLEQRRGNNGLPGR